MGVYKDNITKPSVSKYLHLINNYTPILHKYSSMCITLLKYKMPKQKTHFQEGLGLCEDSRISSCGEGRDQSHDQFHHTLGLDT